MCFGSQFLDCQKVDMHFACWIYSKPQIVEYKHQETQVILPLVYQSTIITITIHNSAKLILEGICSQQWLCFHRQALPLRQLLLQKLQILFLLFRSRLFDLFCCFRNSIINTIQLREHCCFLSARKKTTRRTVYEHESSGSYTRTGNASHTSVQYAAQFIWVDPIPSTVLEIYPLNAGICDLLPPNLLIRN